MEVNRYDNQDIPLCKFGPGGDFITEWPAPSCPQQFEVGEPNPLGKVLGLIGRFLGSAIGPDLIRDLTAELQPVEENVCFSATDLTPSVQEKTQNEQANESPDYAQAAGRTPGRGRVPRQTLLFSDDRGAGRGSRRKPSYRSRASRRPSRKRTGPSNPRQGTLFTLNRSGKTTAYKGSAA